MVLNENNDVVAREVGHLSAIIIHLGLWLFFTINVKEKTAQENSFDFALVGLFMLISCHNENLKYRSASLGNVSIVP